MPSPVLQAQRQADFVRAHLLDKMLGLQVQVGAMPIDVLVAISDGGQIERGRATLPQVCKADQAPQQVQTLVSTYRKTNSPLGLLLGSMRYAWHTLHLDEMTRLVMFFRHQHRPLYLPAAPIVPHSVAPAPVQSLVAGMDLPPPEQLAPSSSSAHYGEPRTASMASRVGHADTYTAQPPAAFDPPPAFRERRFCAARRAA